MAVPESFVWKLSAWCFLQHPLTAGSQDVMVVVQCAPQQQHTLPAASAAARDTIKAFADSVTKSTSGKLVKAYRRLSGHTGSATTLDQQTIRQWRKQTALMWVWLLSSLVVVMFVPLFVAPGALLLASLTASALGVIAVVMHSLGDRLAASGEDGSSSRQQALGWSAVLACYSCAAWDRGAGLPCTLHNHT